MPPKAWDHGKTPLLATSVAVAFTMSVLDSAYGRSGSSSKSTRASSPSAVALSTSTCVGRSPRRAASARTKDGASNNDACTPTRSAYGVPTAQAQSASSGRRRGSSAPHASHDGVLNTSTSSRPCARPDT